MHTRKILRIGLLLGIVAATAHADVIHIAANQGDVEMLKLLIKSNPESLDRPGPGGLTPLGCAAKHNHKAAVMLLLDEGARDTATAAIQAATAGHLDLLKAICERGVSARVRDKHRRTLLIHAAIVGHAEMARYLVDEKKLDVNATGPYDQTALHAAAENGHVAVVRLLCAAGANLDAKTSFRNRQKLSNSITALMMAARIGRVDCVQALLTAGAAIDARSTYEETALLHAVYRGHAKVVALLLKHEADFSLADKDGDGPLSNAAGLGNLAITKLLIDAGADIHATNKKGHTPVVMTLAKVQFHTMRMLVEAGADPNSSFKDMTLLAMAIGKKEDALAYALLKKGARPNGTPDQKFSPLILAAMNKDFAMVKALVDRGADVAGGSPMESSPGRIRTALQMAARANSMPMVRFLLENGAVLVIPEATDLTALAFAALNGNAAMVRLLLDKGAEMNARSDHGTPLTLAITKGHAHVVRVLLNNGANPELRDHKGRTPLHVAAYRNRATIIPLLIKMGAAITPMAKQGKRDVNPLRLALEAGSGEAAEALIANGAPIDAIKNAQAPLLLGAIVSGSPDTVRRYLKHAPKGDIERRTTNGHTPLLLATRYGLPSIVKVLVEAGADVNARVEKGSAMKIEDTGKSVLVFARARLDSKGGAGKNPGLAEMVRYLKSKGAR